jgi:hypothetical protein
MKRLGLLRALFMNTNVTHAWQLRAPVVPNHLQGTQEEGYILGLASRPSAQQNKRVGIA